MATMRTYMDLITERDDGTDLIRRLNHTALSLRMLLKSPNPNAAERTQLYKDLQQQIGAARKLAATLGGNGENYLTTTINTILRNNGLLAAKPASAPATAAPAPPAAPAAPVAAQQRRYDDDPHAPPETVKPTDKDTKWRIVKLATKVSGDTQSTLGIAEVKGQYVIFQGTVGDKYSVSPSGSREAAESNFNKAKAAGFQEISPGHYPVIRGGSLPDLSAFGRRRDPYPVPKGSMSW